MMKGMLTVLVSMIMGLVCVYGQQPAIDPNPGEIPEIGETPVSSSNAGEPGPEGQNPASSNPNGNSERTAPYHDPTNPGEIPERGEYPPHGSNQPGASASNNHNQPTGASGQPPYYDPTNPGEYLEAGELPVTNSNKQGTGAGQPGGSAPQPGGSTGKLASGGSTGKPGIGGVAGQGTGGAAGNQPFMDPGEYLEPGEPGYIPPQTGKAPVVDNVNKHSNQLNTLPPGGSVGKNSAKKTSAAALNNAKINALSKAVNGQTTLTSQQNNNPNQIVNPKSRNNGLQNIPRWSNGNTNIQQTDISALIKAIQQSTSNINQNNYQNKDTNPQSRRNGPQSTSQWSDGNTYSQQSIAMALKNALLQYNSNNNTNYQNQQVTANQQLHNNNNYQNHQATTNQQVHNNKPQLQHIPQWAVVNDQSNYYHQGSNVNLNQPQNGNTQHSTIVNKLAVTVAKALYQKFKKSPPRNSHRVNQGQQTQLIPNKVNPYSRNLAYTDQFNKVNRLKSTQAVPRVQKNQVYKYNGNTNINPNQGSSHQGNPYQANRNQQSLSSTTTPSPHQKLAFMLDIMKAFNAGKHKSGSNVGLGKKTTQIASTSEQTTSASVNVSNGNTKYIPGPVAYPTGPARNVKKKRTANNAPLVNNNQQYASAPRYYHNGQTLFKWTPRNSVPSANQNHQPIGPNGRGQTVYNNRNTVSSNAQAVSSNPQYISGQVAHSNGAVAYNHRQTSSTYVPKLQTGPTATNNGQASYNNRQTTFNLKPTNNYSPPSVPGPATYNNAQKPYQNRQTVVKSPPAPGQAVYNNGQTSYPKRQPAPAPGSVGYNNGQTAHTNSRTGNNMVQPPPSPRPAVYNNGQTVYSDRQTARNIVQPPPAPGSVVYNNVQTAYANRQTAGKNVQPPPAPGPAFYNNGQTAYANTQTASKNVQPPPAPGPAVYNGQTAYANTQTANKYVQPPPAPGPAVYNNGQTAYVNTQAVSKNVQPPPAPGPAVYNNGQTAYANTHTASKNVQPPPAPGPAVYNNGQTAYANTQTASKNVQPPPAPRAAVYNNGQAAYANTQTASKNVQPPPAPGPAVYNNGQTAYANTQTASKNVQLPPAPRPAVYNYGQNAYQNRPTTFNNVQSPDIKPSSGPRPTVQYNGPVAYNNNNRPQTSNGVQTRNMKQPIMSGRLVYNNDRTSYANRLRPSNSAPSPIIKPPGSDFYNNGQIINKVKSSTNIGPPAASGQNIYNNIRNGHRSRISRSNNVKPSNYSVVYNNGIQYRQMRNYKAQTVQTNQKIIPNSLTYSNQQTAGNKTPANTKVKPVQEGKYLLLALYGPQDAKSGYQGHRDLSKLSTPASPNVGYSVYHPGGQKWQEVVTTRGNIQLIINANVNAQIMIDINPALGEGMFSVSGPGTTCFISANSQNREFIKAITDIALNAKPGQTVQANAWTINTRVKETVSSNRLRALSTDLMKQCSGKQKILFVSPIVINKELRFFYGTPINYFILKGQTVQANAWTINTRVKETVSSNRLRALSTDLMKQCSGKQKILFVSPIVINKVDKRPNNCNPQCCGETPCCSDCMEKLFRNLGRVCYQIAAAKFCIMSK